MQRDYILMREREILLDERALKETPTETGNRSHSAGLERDRRSNTLSVASRTY